MKTLHLSIIAVTLSVFVISTTNSVWAEKQLNDAIMIPFKDSELVVVGKIITANSSVSEIKTEYAVAVEKYLKNPKPYDLLTAVGDGVRKKITNYDEVKYYNEPIFEEGNRVLLYLNNKGGQYTISPYSFAITKGLPYGGPPDLVDFTYYKTSYYGNDIITVSGIVEKGYLYSSAAEYGANSTVSIVVHNPHNEKYLSDIVGIKPDGSFNYKFPIKGILGISGDYEYDLLIGTTLTGSTFEYVTDPLKQFKSGVATKDVKCRNEFQLVIKLAYDSPACVKPSSVQKVVGWGWAKPI